MFWGYKLIYLGAKIGKSAGKTTNKNANQLTKVKLSVDLRGKKRPGAQILPLRHPVIGNLRLH